MRRDGKDIFLRSLNVENVTEGYVNWMEDVETMQYLESRWSGMGSESLKEYVRRMDESPSDYLLGIYSKDGNRHIGNLKIGGIHPIHRYADLGLIIGPNNLRGRGFGTQAIHLGTELAFEELNLNKLWAGLYANNVGSYRAFKKAGYRKAGVLKQHRFYRGEYVDEVIMEKCKV